MLDALVYKKNLVPEKQRLYQHSHKPIYYRPARSGLYMGTLQFFFAAIGKIVTSLLGLYKAGFSLGVFGIAYSAYSLVKVGGYMHRGALTRC
ncbi:hypothetical protein EDB83DRAFT_2347962 [Lactarius deliciosus]|nr:hypothetical protein EDB83DRAFT_2347962 [Lactarius deliciosus]